MYFRLENSYTQNSQLKYVFEMLLLAWLAVLYFSLILKLVYIFMSFVVDAGKYFLREPDPSVPARKVRPRERHVSQDPLLVEYYYCGEDSKKCKSTVSLRSFYTEKLSEERRDLKKRLKSKFVLYQDEKF
ncbi:UNVERIFIED_CONTAM: hypothetical protein PYX00_006637 [Menopon gallinae]|uniref:Uncharacterized protein n=1 Tax=Menopon gallinae TaxID=328185 RepID=A0AAW2HWI6_9NEOP